MREPLENPRVHFKYKGISKNSSVYYKYEGTSQKYQKSTRKLLLTHGPSQGKPPLVLQGRVKPSLVLKGQAKPPLVI
jgi:hypothetical protein